MRGSGALQRFWDRRDPRKYLNDVCMHVINSLMHSSITFGYARHYLRGQMHAAKSVCNHSCIASMAPSPLGHRVLPTQQGRAIALYILSHRCDVCCAQSDFASRPLCCFFAVLLIEMYLHMGLGHGPR
jgi:hypothetical protein